MERYGALEVRGGLRGQDYMMCDRSSRMYPLKGVTDESLGKKGIYMYVVMKLFVINSQPIYIMRVFVVYTNGKMVPLVDKFRSRFYQWYHWYYAIGTNGTNVTNIRQQMTQTEYSVGNSTNAGKVT